jgi:hypothetical protein
MAGDAFRMGKQSRHQSTIAGEQILRNSGTNIAHNQADRAFYSHFFTGAR